jgi:replicative DNA helicase
VLANVGIERAILASVCRHGKNALIEIEDIGVRTESFTQTENQAVFNSLKTILEQHDEIDQALLVITLKELGYQSLFQKRKDIEFLGSLFNLPVKLENTRQFAARLEKLAIARKAIEKHREAIQNLTEINGNESIDHIVQLSEDPIFDLVVELNKHNETGPTLLFEDIEETYEALKEKDGENMGIPTPWKRYNAAIGGGLRRGGVNLISARPKVGKTTLAKECLIHCSSKLKIPVLFLDTEMGKLDQIIRSLASESGVEMSQIETGRFSKNDTELCNIKMAVKELKGNDKLYYQSIAGKPFDEILAIIRRWIVKHVGFDDEGNTNDCLIVYDYFKLMDRAHLENLKEYEAMGYQISRLTDFCKDFDFPCLAFVQLNRQGEVSQSDRLIWLCNSFTKFEKKEESEVVDDGQQNGNRKMTITETRFGGGLEDGDYISLNFARNINKITEVGIRSELRNQRNNAEFGTNDARIENEETQF